MNRRSFALTYFANRIQQAYISLKRGACSPWSTARTSDCSGRRGPLALCGLTATGGRIARKPQTQQTRINGMPRTRQPRLENKNYSPVRAADRGDIGGGDNDVVEQNVGWANNSARHISLYDRFTRGNGSSNGWHKTNLIPEGRQGRGHSQGHDTRERRVENLEAGARDMSSLHSQGGVRRPSSQSSLWYSMQSPPAQDSFDFYPSRSISGGAAVAVSLISPRMSKRIRRLPPPEENELQSLQVQAMRAHPLTLPACQILLLY